MQHLKGWEMFKKFVNGNLHVENFAGAMVRYMKNHIKPSLREKPDHIVFHMGTNDLV